MTTTSTVNRSSPAFVSTAPAGGENGSMDQDNAALLPDPSLSGFGGDSIASLAMLLSRVDEDDRTQARAVARKEDSAALRDADAEVDAMRQKADSDGEAATWTGVGDIAAGAGTAVSGFVPASSGGSVDWQKAVQGMSKSSEGFGQIESGIDKTEAEYQDAEAAKQSAAAQADVRAYDVARTDVEDANASIQKVEQFLEQALQAENASRLTAASYRA
jgi:hypothetical protein